MEVNVIICDSPLCLPDLTTIMGRGQRACMRQLESREPLWGLPNTYVCFLPSLPWNVHMESGTATKVPFTLPTSFQGTEVSEDSGPKQNESKIVCLLHPFMTKYWSTWNSPELGISRTKDRCVTHRLLTSPTLFRIVRHCWTLGRWLQYQARSS